MDLLFINKSLTHTNTKYPVILNFFLDYIFQLFDIISIASLLSLLSLLKIYLLLSIPINTFIFPLITITTHFLFISNNKISNVT